MTPFPPQENIKVLAMTCKYVQSPALCLCIQLWLQRPLAVRPALCAFSGGEESRLGGNAGAGQASWGCWAVNTPGRSPDPAALGGGSPAPGFRLLWGTPRQGLHSPTASGRSWALAAHDGEGPGRAHSLPCCISLLPYEYFLGFSPK